MLYLGRDKAYLMPEARVQRFGGADFSQYAYKKSAAGKEKRNSSMMIETNSPEETYAFGKKLGMEAQAGQVYCLNGDLGVGKTVLRRGLPRTWNSGTGQQPDFHDRAGVRRWAPAALPF